jgi:hypothetical protein
MQVGEIRIEEGVGLARLRNAPRAEQLRQHERQARFCSEGLGCFRMLFGYNPSIERRLAP